MLAGASATAGCAAAPVPVTETLCGLPGALSAIVTVAVRVPTPVGVKVTEIEQVAFTARVAGAIGQLFDCAYSPAFAPATAMLLMVSGPVPVFWSVVACAALVVFMSCEEKVRPVGVRVTAGAAATPVPERPTAWGLPAALSAIVTDATRLPGADGANVTEIVQLEPAARLAGQSVVLE